MSLAVRVISIIAWVLVQITYGTALFSPYFRRMSLDIMRRIGVILFVIAQLVVTGTLISIFVVWPSCDVFNVGILLYCISAIFWVPFVLARFPIAIQRVPLVFSLFGALLTTGAIFVTGDNPWLYPGLVVWCALNIMDVFVWDLLYMKWRREGGGDDTEVLPFRRLRALI